jgi:hypothetical protein
MIRYKLFFLMIVIYFSFLCFLPSSAQTHKGSLSISWSQNNENDLAGYRVYYGVQSRLYHSNKDVGKSNECTLDNLEPDKLYYIALTAYDITGNESGFSAEVSAHPVMDPGPETVPDVIILYQNYPNPFNPSTTIPYELSEDGHISLRVLNPKGQTIRVLYQGDQTAGFHQVDWDGRDEFNSDIASGVYFIRLETEFFKLTKTMIIFR